MSIKTTELKTITIPLSRYQELIKDYDLLAQLMANGVDNWEGFPIHRDDESYKDIYGEE